MALTEIFVKGAREHNLKNIDVAIPRDKLVVITGLSGSGKSSLAFDTIYAEGQRRYVESLSAYARQFLEQMDKPDVDSIEGLSPAISIEQKTTSRNPRSTVGTITEIYDYLRLLFARIGEPTCYHCGQEITSQTVQQIVDQFLALPAGHPPATPGPPGPGRKGEHQKLFDQLRKAALCGSGSTATCASWKRKSSWIKKRSTPWRRWSIDSWSRKGPTNALADSLELALNLSQGFVRVLSARGRSCFSANASPVTAAGSACRN